MNDSPYSFPPGVLLALSAVVLLAHLVVLSDVPQPPGHSLRAISAPFQTRTVRAPDAATPATGTPRRPAKAPATAPVASERGAGVERAPVAPAPIALPPPPRRIFYDLLGQVRGVPYSATGELLWQHDASGYNARAVVSTFLQGSRVQASIGTLSAQGLVPTRFGDKVRSEVAAHFEWDKGLIIFSASTSRKALLPGAQDHLSLFIQLASLLAGEPSRYPQGSLIEMQAVGPRDAEIWQFEVEGEETLHLPGGELSAVKLKRVAQKTYDLTVEMWLAPSLDYLPARIRLTQNNGDFTDQQWMRSDTP